MRIAIHLRENIAQHSDSICDLFIQVMSIQNWSTSDPEPGVFGSHEEIRRIVAGNSQKEAYCCGEWIIVFQELKIADYCTEWTSHADGELSTKRRVSFSP